MAQFIKNLFSSVPQFCKVFCGLSTKVVKSTCTVNFSLVNHNAGEK